VLKVRLADNSRFAARGTPIVQSLELLETDDAGAPACRMRKDGASHTAQTDNRDVVNHASLFAKPSFVLLRWRYPATGFGKTPR
jgi:hypothetical protein